MARLTQSGEGAAEVALDPRALRFGDAAAIQARAWGWVQRRPWIVVAALLAAGLVVRLLLVRGIWVDEAISIDQAQMSLPGMLQDLRENDVHPPLYFVVLWLSSRAFGYGELAVHIPSIAAGIALVPAMFLAGREVFDRRTGLVAAGLAAFAPLVVWYSQEARGYALLMLLAVVAVWAQAMVLRDGRARYWAAYGAATIALVYAEYWSIVLIAVQQVAFAAVAWHRARRGEPVRALLVGCWLTWIAVIVALLPLASFAYEQFANNREVGFSRSPAAGSAQAGIDLSVYAVLSNLLWAIWGYHADETMLRLAALWPLLMLLSLMLLGRGRSPATLYVLALALAPMLVMFLIGFAKRELFEVRYFAVSVPMLLLLCARAVSAPALRRGPALLAGGVLFVSIAAACANQQLSPHNPRSFDFRGAMESVRERARPGDTLLYTPNYLEDVIDYYGPHPPARPVRGPASVPRDGGVFLIASFFEVAGGGSRAGAAKYTIGSGPRELVAVHSRHKVRIWEFR